jgi:hypothetical protein
MRYSAPGIDLDRDAARRQGDVPLQWGTETEKGLKWVQRGFIWAQQIRHLAILPTPPLHCAQTFHRGNFILEGDVYQVCHIQQFSVQKDKN